MTFDRKSNGVESTCNHCLTRSLLIITDDIRYDIRAAYGDKWGALKMTDMK